jgi:glycosyltransferase involved in cell wall biosynthesis
MPYLIILILLICPFLQTGHSAPPLVLPLNPAYQDQYGLFDGYSCTWDDDLMLDSMTASASMNVPKKTEAAMENLRRITDPLVLAKLSAPGGMAKNLLLTLYWLAEADLNLADVVFTGFLDKEQQASLWANSSALVVPSIWDEPFGMVVLEAWAKERPVVAFAKGALPELIHHGVNGLLADPFSVEALAKNIQELIDKPDLGPRLGRAGSLRLKDEFNRTLWLSRIEAVYQKALSGASC